MATDTIVHRFFDQANLRPNAPAYHVKSGASWQSTSWKTYVQEARIAARALLTLGVGRNQSEETSNEGAPCVCILGFNRPEWTIIDIATMAVGGAPAGIYTSCSPSEIAYIVNHTEAKVIVVEDEEKWHKVAAKRDELPHLEHVVMMKGVSIDDDLAMTWEEFMAKGEETADDVLDTHVDALREDGLATLIYTSGTTGPPKGVMLTHKNLSWTAQWAVDAVSTTPGDCSLSYLPLSHIAEQMFTLHLPATIGSQVYFAESMEAVADNLKEVQPTLLFGVPRIYEKMYTKVAEGLEKAPPLKAKIVALARKVGADVTDAKCAGREAGPLTKLVHPLFDKQVYSKLKTAMGLSRARMCVTGAAPISADIIRFFASLDLVIHEVYGQSEGCGPTSFNLPGRTKFGTVGPPLAGVQVKIAEDDEILVKGPNVFAGYYKDADATTETLIDGWLHSGDLGRIDEDGFLCITGRKKDIIITAGGKNIAPKNIEAAIKNHPMVGEAVVIGDRRKYLTALVSLDAESIDAFASEHGIDAAKVHESPQLRGDLQAHIDQVNAELARVEQVKKFTVVATPFSPETGELTPTLKVKRRIVNERHADTIDSMYGEGQSKQPAA